MYDGITTILFDFDGTKTHCALHTETISLHDSITTIVFDLVGTLRNSVPHTHGD